MKGSDIKDGSIIVKVNPKLYPLDAVYSAAYVFLDRAYVLLDGDPKKEIIVKLKPKRKENLEVLSGEFSNELINYADYQKRAEKTRRIREVIMQRALITNDPSVIQININGDFAKAMKELEDDEDLGYSGDPEGIAMPWEGKYGKKNRGKPKKDAKAK